MNENVYVKNTYCGPSEFLEAGTRGFLVTTLPDKEEFALDDAIDLLRQAAIKLTGGIPVRLFHFSSQNRNFFFLLQCTCS